MADEIRVWIKRSLIAPAEVPRARTFGRFKPVRKSRSNDGLPPKVLIPNGKTDDLTDEDDDSLSISYSTALPTATSSRPKTPPKTRPVYLSKKLGRSPARRKIAPGRTHSGDGLPSFMRKAGESDDDDISIHSAFPAMTARKSGRRPSSRPLSKRITPVGNRSTDSQNSFLGGSDGSEDLDDDMSIHSAMPTMITTKSPDSEEELYEWALGWMKKGSDSLSVRLDPSEIQSTWSKKEAVSVTLPLDKLETDILIATDHDKMSLPPDDLGTLDHFHEPTVVECLRSRFVQGYIYTSTGPVLVALNPFETSPDLYGDKVMERYWNRAETSSKESLPPHVYSIADNSFRSMMRGIQMSADNRSTNKFDQSILVSGESGAGKTVTTKYIMKYLATLSQRANMAATCANRAYLQTKQKAEAPKPPPRQTRRLNASTATLAGSSSSSIEAQVLQSNPILESFGNARTVRNDNSSRFGKFIQMQFTRTGRLVGTRIDTYLLENVRVVHQNPGERNYHVFYELLSGAVPSEELAPLYLDPISRPPDFKMLSSGTYGRRDGVSGAEGYRDLVKAMRMIGFTEAERRNVFSVTSALLHASNLAFQQVGDEGCGLEPGNQHLVAVCSLLGVTQEALNEALCVSTITAQGTSIRSPQTVAKAQKGLNAFLKATYGALFTFLVNRINESIAFKEPVDESKSKSLRPCSVIGVLDIFGFESFTVNSFEQLCINYCNEVLQQQFNTFMLKNEQAEYVSEGIDWDFITFPENQDVLDLIDHKTNGIMSILDDMCRAGANDKIFAAEVVKRCETNAGFEAIDKRSSPIFSVKHYAGVVEYTMDDFVEKNRNELPKESSVLLMGSESPFVHKLAEIIAAGTPNSTADQSSEGGKARAKATRPTVGGQFRQQVKELRQKIDTTSPHYVRCIKPNSLLSPGHFDAVMVAKQLRCGGILQAVSVTRDGFTLHYTHSDFLNRYKNVSLKEGARDENRGKSISKTATRASKKEIEADCKKLVGVLLKKIEVEERSGRTTSASKSSSAVSAQPKNDENEDWIQFGKTKVLLKHHAFETLERLIGAMQSKSATKLNSMFRRFLNRVAFLSVRDTFRAELQSRGETFEEWFKENREVYYRPRDKNDIKIPNLVSLRMKQYREAASGKSRRAVSTKKTINLENPAWLVVDGLWQRNPDYVGK
jgi:myosin-5